MSLIVWWLHDLPDRYGILGYLLFMAIFWILYFGFLGILGWFFRSLGKCLNTFFPPHREDGKNDEDKGDE